MTTGRQLMLIAEFARRCRLPVSALRYYDRVGLLRPAEVDARTGYRRYGSEQLGDAVTVAELRAVGAGHHAIASILAGGDERTAALTAERARIDGEIRHRVDALARLDRLGDVAVDTPTRVRLVPVEVPALRISGSPADLSATVRRGIATLRARLRRRHLVVGGWGALLPLDIDDEVVGHVFADVQATDARVTDAHDGLDRVSLPSGDAFRIAHGDRHGPLAHAYDRVLSVVARSGAVPRAPVVERYGSAPGTDVEITVAVDPPPFGPL